MKDEQKRAIWEYLKKVDPEGEVVSVNPSDDLRGGTISFSDEISQHRVETQLKGEKWVEAYIIARMTRELGYPAKSIELQKEYPAGHPETTKPRIDIVVRDDRSDQSKTFMTIEAKDPEDFEKNVELIEGQLFGLGDHERSRGLKYMVYYTVDFIDGDLVDKSIIIDADQFPTFEAWDEEGRPSFDQLPAGYAMAHKSVFVNKNDEELDTGERNLNKQVSRNEFLALRRELHNVLWGGGSATDNDVFSNLVKLFLAKIYDEEFTPEGQPYTFQVVFKDGKPQPASEIVAKLNSKRKLVNGLYEGIFRRAQKEYLEMSDEEIEASQGIDTEKISDNKVAYVVERFQGISLTENEDRDDGDLLGEFFEGIVRSGFKQSKGQFFTHPYIVKFCIYALKIDLMVEEKVRSDNTLPSIVDPSCGSGTFLIEAMKTVTRVLRSPALVSSVHKRARQLIASWTPPLKENIWARDYIYGIETSPDLALATKVNMVLHGDGNINILVKDGLLDFSRYDIQKKVSSLAQKVTKKGFPYTCPVNEQFDVILSNPPFSVDLDTQTKRGLTTRFEYANKRNSENLFVERWYQLLKPGGRLAVVLPEAVFDTKENDYIRLFLFKYFHVKAVVALPEVTFKPWTPTRTSLLFAAKKNDSEVRAYDHAWREQTKVFKKLVKSPLINHVVTGDKLISRVGRLCTSYDIRIPLAPTSTETVANLAGVLERIMSLPTFDKENHLDRATRYHEEIRDWVAVDINSSWHLPDAERELRKLLKSFYDEGYSQSPLQDQVNRHWEEIVQIVGSDWWVFTEVASTFDEEIFYYEVEHVGYKRTTNKERVTPNELFVLNEDGTIDVDNTGSILGQIRAKVEY